MYRFLFGIFLGIVLAAYLNLGEGYFGSQVRRGVSDLRRRAESGLRESRHIASESREKMADVGVHSLQRKAQRLRPAVEEPEQPSQPPPSSV